MSWQTLSLHFRQTFDGGYRYFDRCGEFMVAAIEKMDFVPGEIKPTGANLEIPERGLTTVVDASQLAVAQELANEKDDFFLQTCVGLAGLATEHFTPKRITRNGFALKCYWPISNPEILLATTLTFGGTWHIDLGKAVGMAPAHKRIDYNFLSGSMALHVVLQPVTFEKVTINRLAASYNATKSEKRRVERQGKFVENFKSPPSHALMLELDLTEAEPPQDSLGKHFEELKRHANELRQQFKVQ